MGLPWIRMDVSFLRNPKLITLRQNKRHEAIVLHLAALLYCGEHGTDGYVTREIVGEIRGRKTDIDALVGVHLWLVDGDSGWQINGWVDKQATNKETETRSNRMRAVANARWHPGVEVGNGTA